MPRSATSCRLRSITRPIRESRGAASAPTCRRAAAALVLAVATALHAAAPARAGEPAVVAADLYPVGAARVDVTPDHPVRLGGFGDRRAEAEGVTGRIHARALAIGGDAEGPAVLVAVDTTGIPTSLPAEVARRLAPRGVRPERLAITVTHSHAAPLVTGYLTTLFGVPIPADHQRNIDRYTARLIDSIEAACVAALEAREPARLFYGIGEFDLAKNRRLPDGLPVDHDLPVLVVKSPAGEVRAVWASYACHAVILGHNSVDGDWPGYAADTLERELPGARALVSIGCGADQNPDAPVKSDRVDVARREGARLADEVRAVLRGPLRPVAGPLTASLRGIELPLQPIPDRSHWEPLAAKDGAVGHHARTQLAALDRGEALPTQIDQFVQSWSFGESLDIVFLSGEVVVDYAARIKREFDRQRVLVVGYTNGVPCYIPSERVLGDGRFAYENSTSMRYYNVPAPLAAGLEQRILDEVTRQVPEAFRSPLRQDTPGTAAVVPLTPRQSHRRLRVPPGLSVELVAAEPLTIDPVAIDFGPDGSLWVCEMRDYPLGLRGDFEPGGRIRVLRDDDGDGVYDRSTVFLDGLPFPTGVTVWRDGVLVCAAPDIVFAADTDGDDRADVRRPLFSGFGTENYQARVNGLAFGLDGWVYGSCGLFGGEIRAASSDRPVPLGNRDFRIDPDRCLLEPLVGTSQQGRVRNDDGDWFGCTNGLALFHVPLADHRGPPGLAAPRATVPLAAGRTLYPRAAGQRFKLSGPPGGVTAACGLGIYRDDLLGGIARGDAVVCEPVNLVLHREHLDRAGTTFTATRDPREAADEFLTSTDGWFRPVQVRTGPDGALWVVDMSRAVIEHPRWIPEDVRAGLDVRGGDRQGRIFRIVPADRGPRPVPRLDRHSAAELVDSLQSPNGTVRDLAQQLLLWRDDRGVAARLAAVVDSDAAAAARAAALWILARWGAADRDLLERAIASGDPTVRRHALRVLAAHPLPPADTRRLLVAVEPRGDAASMLAAVEVMRAVPDAADLDRIVEWLIAKGDDEWLRFAAVRAVPRDRWADFVRRLLASPARPAAVDAAAVSVTLAGDDAEAWHAVIGHVASAAPPPWQLAESCAAARSRNPARFARLAGSEDVARWDAFVDRGRRAFDEATSADAMSRIAGALADGGPAHGSDLERLLARLTPQAAPGLQSRIVAVLFRDDSAAPVGPLLDRFGSLAPAARGELLDRVLSRPEFVGRLLAAVEAGTVPPHAVDAQRRQQLTSHRDPRIAARASSIFGGLAAARADVLAAHRDVLGLVGDAARGKGVAMRACAACHAVEGQGHAVGPDLGESRNKPWSAILEAVLDPNRAVDMRYAGYVAVLADGRTVLGLLAAESDDSITLKGQEGRATVVSRRDIDELSCSGRSLMPEGMEKDLTRQDLADLCAFVTGRSGSGEAGREAIAAVAGRILDHSRPPAERDGIIAAEAGRSAELIAALATGLGSDAKEEYLRIPWIWRVAVAAGKRNDPDEVREILRASLPARGAALADWQAVVVGGGIVNGITLAGGWPHERIAQAIGGDGGLRGRWDHALAESVTMADREATPKGTRYDALRMIAMLGWQRGGARLVAYLGPDADKELQMGAVSGLADIPAAEATEALIGGLPHLAGRNREFAIDGLLRAENRAVALLDAVAAGRVPAATLDEARRARLLQSSSAAVRGRAAVVLAPR